VDRYLMWNSCGNNYSWKKKSYDKWKLLLGRNYPTSNNDV